VVFEAKLGDFFRVARTHRPAKSLTGIRGSLEWCALPDTLMAKVEPRETVRKGVQATLRRWIGTL
jgi:hypothetical protein